jgi:hypothetical protein
MQGAFIALFWRGRRTSGVVVVERTFSLGCPTSGFRKSRTPSRESGQDAFERVKTGVTK